jgi:CheY-like chemotaxis protein
MTALLTGIRIVIAEDHDDTRYIVEHVLRHLGATVTGAPSAREALAMVPEADIILTDFSMPEHDGVWLLEQVNQHPRPIPVISVSGFAEQHVPRLAQARFARKLLKPVDAWELAELIVEVLRTGSSPK